jgi:Spy/CpxP family protein refolding chaperone
MRTLGILILTAGLASAQAPTAAAAAEVDALRARIRALTEAQAANQASIQQLVELERKLVDLRKKYTEMHPEVVKAVAELNALRAKMGSGAATAHLIALQDQARAEQDMLRAQEAKLRAELERNSAQKLQVSPTLPANLPENWWRNEGAARIIGLSAPQIKRMDEIFQQSRLKLIDQKAALEKEEATLEPMVEAETIDEAKAAAQLDRVAQARAELEKTRGRMLLGIRKQLDMEQWQKLKSTRTIVEKMTLR